MFDRKIVTKEYKFIYRSCGYAGDLDAGMINWNYTFGNRRPEGYDMFCEKFRLPGFFKDNTDLPHIQKNNLNKIIPMTEANITMLMVKHWRYVISERLAAKRNRQKELTEYVWKGPGYVDMKSTYEYSLIRIDNQIKAYRRQLKIWRDKYNLLKKQGVYTYMELIK